MDDLIKKLQAGGVSFREQYLLCCALAIASKAIKSDSENTFRELYGNAICNEIRLLAVKLAD